MTTATHNRIAAITQRLGDNEAALIISDSVDGVSYCIASAATAHDTASTVVYEATNPDSDPPETCTVLGVWVVEHDGLTAYLEPACCCNTEGEKP